MTKLESIEDLFGSVEKDIIVIPLGYLTLWKGNVSSLAPQIEELIECEVHDSFAEIKVTKTFQHDYQEPLECKYFMKSKVYVEKVESDSNLITSFQDHDFYYELGLLEPLQKKVVTVYYTLSVNDNMFYLPYDFALPTGSHKVNEKIELRVHAKKKLECIYVDNSQELEILTPNTFDSHKPMPNPLPIILKYA